MVCPIHYDIKHKSLRSAYDMVFKSNQKQIRV